MDRFKFTTIGHRAHRLCSPISDERLDGIFALLDLGQHSRIVDIAAGKAELSIRLIECFGLSAVAVEHSPHFVEEARAQAAQRVADGRIEFLTMDAQEYDAPAERFDLAICIGARPYGTRLETLRAISELVKPGGYLLIGEGFWKKEPDAEFLAFLGCGADEYVDHDQNIAMGAREGLAAVYAEAVSTGELDDYDGRYAAAIEQYVRENPDDPDAAHFGERIRKWREAYVKWFRDTVGFGVYLYKLPQRAS